MATSLTVIVTRDVEDRYRGFLASVMLEISPGVYTSATMSHGVRERVWKVVSGWHEALARGSLVMTWAEPEATGGQGLAHCGEPPRHIVDAGGVLLVNRERAPG